jgi:ABC-type nickel/cobalt efflux system permease component RcnA
MKHLPFSIGGWMLLALFWMTLMAWPAAAEMPLSDAAAVQENPAEPAHTAHPWDRAVAWTWSQHQQFHHRLTEELRGLSRQEGSAWLLVLLGFLYGIFHAAGPGHGKAVLSSYLLTQGRDIRRGVAMAIASALLQGVTAVVLVYGLMNVADWLPQETQNAVTWSERISFFLVSVIGIVLMARGTESVLAVLRKAYRHKHHDHHDHHENHAHHCSCTPVSSPDQIGQARDLRMTLGVIFAIGLRPCGGAILVLIFAHMMKLSWAGIAAVLAMSIGTAITVSALALLVLHARRWALKITGQSSPLWTGIGGIITLLGGVLVFAVGLSLSVHIHTV